MLQQSQSGHPQTSRSDRRQARELAAATTAEAAANAR
eukprot:CAMPEP_0176192850 /NCGR_PEP_ID=MMETSP0121_2-20121125/5182_1 /TAXON_ID=160619 /ORGANISM="Kryptoperidinium foliaceum, Strain CCMP 1326" /LENGTH=36 /DNA_ID= /DNA_START= /DNA_END= /DNA_ORIENTATION=